MNIQSILVQLRGARLNKGQKRSKRAENEAKNPINFPHLLELWADPKGSENSETL